jgi:sugar phosphate isomerase/epimerase
MISRRAFLKDSLGVALTAAAASRARFLEAETLPLPLGLQLYSVREMLPNDYDGTLHHIAALGYREVEAAGFYGHTAPEVKLSMTSAGLHCVGAHYPFGQLNPNLDDILKFADGLGLQYIICASPGRKNPGQKLPPHTPLSLEDWRWNAEQLNRIGKRVKAAGFQLGYHNHYEEFHIDNGIIPYNELLRLTDPELVTMELDCGWVTVGGQSAVKYLTEHPHRFSYLHLKDFKRGVPITTIPPAPPTELGRGSIDYRPIFRAAVKCPIRHCYVEQEGFDIPPWESLKVDADYVRTLEF